MAYLRSALLHLFALAFLCVGSAISSPQELRVLFIGNSLTYSNDLPAIVAALAEASQQKRFVYKTIAYPDFGLEDHWKKGEAQKAMAKDKWDFVVLQQGPSGLPESRVSLIKYTHLFAEKIRAAGARPALYQVWPSAARFNDFPRVLESYQLAAKEVNGLLLPVGAAWLSAWNRDASLKLYAEDQFHPSEMGSYLAALVLYEKLFGTPPSSVPTNLQYKSKKKAKIEVTKEQALLLQAAATAANQQF
ncbi:MAG: SGNH/GDSL hydrolase family protein [Blastocatellia bacterium]|nr:SGNH/GDSL hydrolase family protein [Blastocatellia bacterium]